MKKLLLAVIFVASVSQVWAAPHSITLSCTASVTSGVTGYNFYRGGSAGTESTTPLNPSPVSTCGYVDSAVIATQTYFYIAKAFCPTCIPSLSGTSNEVSGTVPGDPQPAPPTGVTLTAQ